MMKAFSSGTVLLALLLIESGISSSNSTNFTIINNCNDTIWPGITANFTTGGFALKPAQTAVFTAPPAWHGRIWARTRCNFDKNGNGSCQTGSCGTALQCQVSGQPPASIAEFALGDVDYYDVSLVDGFNLPLSVSPVRGKGNCSSPGCDADLLTGCPDELALKSSDGTIVACRSACDVFGNNEYCCKGDFSTAGTCSPTNYSRVFKRACPLAYSYAFDDPTSLMTCSGADYVVAFCSLRNETQCSHHDNRRICSGATTGILKQLSQVWKVLLLAICTAFFI